MRLGKKTLALFLFLTLFGLLGASVLILRQTTGSPDRPDLVCDALLAKENQPLSVMVARYQNVIYEKHQGWQNETASYQIGQLDRMFVAMAVALLHDQELLNVEDVLGTYMPEMPPNISELTIKSLLTHTSGISPEWRHISQQKELGEVGERSILAPLNYTLLRQLVAKVGRLPYHKFVTEHILTPLDLTNISWIPETMNWRATASDLLQYEQHLNSNQLIHLKTYLLFFTVPELNEGNHGAYNCGWEVVNYGGLRMELMYTSEPGFNGIVVRFPEKNFVAVLLSAVDAKACDTRKLAEQLAQTYLSRELPFPIPDA